MTQAVILPAGAGLRRRARGDDRARPLESLDGAPIVGLALDALADAGISSVVAVAECRDQPLADYLARRFDVRITTVEATAFASGGTLASLLAAAPVLDDDFVLLDGALVFEAAIICRLDEAGTRLAVDAARGPDAGAPKVALEDDRIVAIGTDLPPGLVAGGRPIGAARIDRELGRRLFAIAPRVLATVGPHASYEHALQQLIDEGATLEATDVTGLRWARVDDDDDLRRARSLFLAA
jgi:choline kinase